MGRIVGVVLAGLVLLIPGSSFAQREGLAGNWKFSLWGAEGEQTLWLIRLENKDGKWTGKVLDANSRTLPATLADLKVTPEFIRFTLQVQGNALPFEGLVPKGAADKIRGSVELGPQVTPAQLEATQLTSFKDTVEIAKEFLAKHGDVPEVFNAYTALLSQAGARKVKLEEVHSWAEKAVKTAELYGPRWQREMTLRVAEILAPQQGYAAVALENARRVERLLGPTDDLAVQIRVLEVLAAALKNTDKTAEARQVEAHLEQLEAKADQAFLKKLPPLPVVAYGGRKGRSDRVVLAELFTSTQEPRCAAAELACTALTGTYKPTEVVVLEYHLAVVGPDPLASADAEARRSAFYRNEVQEMPTLLVNGQPLRNAGGEMAEAVKRYQEYRTAIDPLLEKPTPVKVKATAVRKGDQVAITAEASGYEEGKVSLRLALVEEEVRYQGGNQMRFHHRVVRAMPGGAQGKALTGKTAKQEVTVDLNELRKQLNEYLDEYARKRGFPDTRRPMTFKRLSVVAFVQDDKTREVLQAAQVPVDVGSASR